MRSVFVVEIMQRLEPSHPRWRSLTVLTDTWAPMHAFLPYSTMPTPPPELEQLSLNRCNVFAGLPDVPPPMLSDPVELFDGNTFLPKLRHVTLAGVRVDYSCTGLWAGVFSSSIFDINHPKYFPPHNNFVRSSVSLRDWNPFLW